VSKDDELDEVIAALRAQFRVRLKSDAEMMRSALRDLGRDGSTQARGAALKQLLAAAHRLSGSAASFGFDAIGAAAGPVEEAVRAVLNAGGEPAIPATLAPMVCDLLALCDAVKEEESRQRQ
jgi:HPt (histidine-containing phosphotransfer) domain-containing protein